MAYSVGKKGHGHGRRLCSELPTGPLKKVVLTGGPGAGKTAVVNLARQQCCQHVRVMRESASILFGGGFPRREGRVEMEAAQRAIFYVQVELETIGAAHGDSQMLLCDRGTVDGLAYWPGDPERFLAQVGTTLAAEYARYDAVLHLRTPRAGLYEGDNGMRPESAEQALRIDERIAGVWADHPNVTTIDSADDFLHKAEQALAVIAEWLPPSCRAIAV